jgi:hypothetical protein
MIRSSQPHSWSRSEQNKDKIDLKVQEAVSIARRTGYSSSFA